MIAERIGRYRIVRPLGSGGFGEVYLVEDPNLQRPVALKILSQADEKAKRRFVREAITASKLSHPNVAVVYEAGEADGTAFIAMQYVEGETLREKLRHGPLTVQEAVRIAGEVADALDDAHKHGIVHRDIKPGNIMIDSHGHAKVLDFGIAKVMELDALTSDSTAVAETTAGKFVGTLQYVSPEQAGGGGIDGRSDIFSLGVVLYEMLTGMNPFAAPNFLETVRRIREVTPPPISGPPELQRIVSKCLEKDRERRYQSARDLELDLEGVGPASAGRRDRPKPVRTLAVAALIIVVAVAAAVLWPRKAAALSQQDTILLGDFNNRTGDPVFDTTLRDALSIQLAQSPYLNFFPESRIRETLQYMGRSPDERLTPPVAREICQRQGVKAFLDGSIAPLGSKYVITLEAIRGDTGDSLVRAQVEASRKEEVLHALGDAASSFRRKVGESLPSVQRFDAPIEQATTSSLEALRAFSLGDERSNHGKFAEAIPFYKQAIDLDPQFAMAWARLAVMYANTLHPELQVQAATKAYEFRTRTTQRERLYIEQLYFRDVTGELEKAIEILRLSIDTYPRDWRAHGNLAVTMENLGMYEQEQLSEARQAMVLAPQAAQPYYLVATALMGLNRGSEARAVLQKAAAMQFSIPVIHWRLQQIAFADNDQKSIERELAWAEKSSVGDWIIQEHGMIALDRGHPAAGEGDFRHAVDVALRRDSRADAARHLGDQLLGLALLGRCANTPSMSRQVLAWSDRPDIAGRAAMALALCGRGDEAVLIGEKLGQTRPRDTLVNSISVPLIRGAAALQRGEPAKAVEFLKPALRYDFSWQAS